MVIEREQLYNLPPVSIYPPAQPSCFTNAAQATVGTQNASMFRPSVADILSTHYDMNPSNDFDVMEMRAVDNNPNLLSEHDYHLSFFDEFMNARRRNQVNQASNMMPEPEPRQERTRQNPSQFNPCFRNPIVPHGFQGLERFPDKTYDFVQNTTALKVRQNVELSTTFEDNLADSYHMRSNPRGIALVINNYFFPKRTEGQVRQGSEKDLEYLYELLTVFKFEVHIKQNVSSTELASILIDFKNCATQNMDACFVAVLSHGYANMVEMSDSVFVSLPNDIVHSFDSRSFPAFAAKPKVFLVQACQSVPSQLNMGEVRPVTPARRDDIELDNILEIYATTPGTTAVRDIHVGSIFIYVFVDTLMHHAHDTDLEALLKLVRYRLSNKVIRNSRNRMYCKWTSHGFYKKLFFNPGL